MKEEILKKSKQAKRKVRSRKKILKTVRVSGLPRLSVFRSNKYLYAQIIDDIKNITLLSICEKSIKELKDKSKSYKATLLGAELAKAALSKGVKKVVFDRGMYRYHGRVKNFAEAARKGGLIF